MKWQYICNWNSAIILKSKEQYNVEVFLIANIYNNITDF